MLRITLSVQACTTWITVKLEF